MNYKIWLKKPGQAGVDYGDAFARLLTDILGKYGLIMLCPLDAQIEKISHADLCRSD